MNESIQLEYVRDWMPDYQTQFIDAKERYTIVEATTKAGKTVSHIVWLFEQALDGKHGYNYWWVAPINTQSKIAMRRMKRFVSFPRFFKENKTEQTLTLPNGATVWFKSADNPDSLYGEDVKAAVMDEFTRCSEDAWVALRSTLTATNGKCKFIGNVVGNMNWGYKLAREVEAGKKENWRHFKVTADDAVNAGILKQSEIDDAKQSMTQGKFLELYYGIPNVNMSNKFAFAFDLSKHPVPCRIDNERIVHLSFDFNKNPICCVVLQIYQEQKLIRVPYAIKLENSNIHRLCEYIANLLPNNYFIVGGDATGKYGNALQVDNLGYYDVIQNKLNLSDAQMQAPASNPRMSDSQEKVNTILEHWTVEIDPTNAKDLIFDLQFVEMQADGTIKKGDRNDPTQQADCLDAFRYELHKL